MRGGGPRARPDTQRGKPGLRLQRDRRATEGGRCRDQHMPRQPGEHRKIGKQRLRRDALTLCKVVLQPLFAQIREADQRDVVGIDSPHPQSVRQTCRVQTDLRTPGGRFSLGEQPSEIHDGGGVNPEKADGFCLECRNMQQIGLQGAWQIGRPVGQNLNHRSAPLSHRVRPAGCAPAGPCRPCAPRPPSRPVPG